MYHIDLNRLSSFQPVAVTLYLKAPYTTCKPHDPALIQRGRSGSISALSATRSSKNFQFVFGPSMET